MKENKNEELKSRRDFFRNAAKAALPILGAIVLTNPIVSNAAEITATSCRSTCSGVCSSNCHYTCTGTCRTTCERTCSGTCEGTCKFSNNK